jgi:hypothetical protein
MSLVVSRRRTLPPSRTTRPAPGSTTPACDHLEGILAYVQTRFSNGRTEGPNGKIRTITRRAFGFHRPESLIALIFLSCSGIAPAHANPLPLVDSSGARFDSVARHEGDTR